uniref:PNPLA domain-containing protein n=1 Tax=Pelagomonas calceolata TaxID=35677 RepID=A0A7S3ZXG0_9STRA
MSGRLSPAKMLGAWLHANGSDGELSLHDDAEPASVEEENASLKRRVAALEATLRRVRGERADLERVRRVMKRNSRLRRKLGLALVASYVLYYCCWNLSFLAGYNKLRGRPRDCAVTRYGGLILEGGGVKGVAYGGAAAALEAYGLLDRRHVTHFAGTSAGAMMGALLAARTPAEDIARYLLDFPFERLMDGGHALANAGRLQRRLGWFRGDEVERAMRELLDKAGVGGNATLGELEKARKTTLRLSVTDLTRGRHAWLDATNMNNVSVARAVRASSAVPFVYPPVQLGKRLFVDGGLVRNLAWDAFGHWGVARKSNRKRRWVPRRRRAVLALSIRGPDRAWAEDFSLRGGDGEEEDDEPAPPRRAFFPFFAGPDEEQETLRRRALNRRGFAGLRAGRKANFTAPSCRVIDLRAIDAASARQRGGEGLSPLDLAGGAASSPRNEFAR